ncbi:MAG: hypothetical protein IJG32_02085 [Selenomonadaceae bacterium]|nr:hypothetical protein [Selenomonadaceae bacterium]
MPSKEETKNLLRSLVKELESRPASQTSAGLMSAADKIKLDNIQFDFESGTLSFLTPKGILTFAAIRGNST